MPKKPKNYVSQNRENFSGPEKNKIGFRTFLVFFPLFGGVIYFLMVEKLKENSKQKLRVFFCPKITKKENRQHNRKGSFFIYNNERGEMYVFCLKKKSI